MSAPGEWRDRATGFVIGAFVGFVACSLQWRAFVSWWHDDLLTVPMLGLIGAASWRGRARGPILGGAIALGLLWTAVAFTPLCGYLAAGLPRHDPEQPADAVYVLASEMQNDGDLSTPAMSRLLHGLELLSEGRSDHLILSELPPPSRSYAAAARTLMHHLGLHATLLVVGPVTSTHEEAQDVARLCRDRGWRRILLVTSPVHSRRAAATFEHAGVQVISSPSVETRYDLETLTLPRDRLEAFSSVMHERIGLWIYRRRGWL